MSESAWEYRKIEYEETYYDLYGCYPGEETEEQLGDDPEFNEETLDAMRKHVRDFLGWK